MDLEMSTSIHIRLWIQRNEQIIIEQRLYKVGSNRIILEIRELEA